MARTISREFPRHFPRHTIHSNSLQSHPSPLPVSPVNPRLLKGELDQRNRQAVRRQGKQVDRVPVGGRDGLGGSRPSSPFPPPRSHPAVHPPAHGTPVKHKWQQQQRYHLKSTPSLHPTTTPHHTTPRHMTGQDPWKGVSEAEIAEIKRDILRQTRRAHGITYGMLGGALGGVFLYMWAKQTFAPTSPVPPPSPGAAGTKE
jgi:hypothetical protein